MKHTSIRPEQQDNKRTKRMEPITVERKKIPKWLRSFQTHFTREDGFSNNAITRWMKDSAGRWYRIAECQKWDKNMLRSPDWEVLNRKLLAYFDGRDPKCFAWCYYDGGSTQPFISLKSSHCEAYQLERCIQIRYNTFYGGRLEEIRSFTTRKMNLEECYLQMMSFGKIFTSHYLFDLQMTNAYGLANVLELPIGRPGQLIMGHQLDSYGPLVFAKKKALRPSDYPYQYSDEKLERYGIDDRNYSVGYPALLRMGHYPLEAREDNTGMVLCCEGKEWSLVESMFGCVGIQARVWKNMLFHSGFTTKLIETKESIIWQDGDNDLRNIVHRMMDEKMSKEASECFVEEMKAFFTTEVVVGLIFGGLEDIIYEIAIRLFNSHLNSNRRYEWTQNQRRCTINRAIQMQRHLREIKDDIHVNFVYIDSEEEESEEEIPSVSVSEEEESVEEASISMDEETFLEADRLAYYNILGL